MTLKSILNSTFGALKFFKVNVTYIGIIS